MARLRPRTEEEIERQYRRRVRQYHWWSLRKDPGRALTVMVGWATAIISIYVTALVNQHQLSLPDATARGWMLYLLLGACACVLGVKAARTRSRTHGALAVLVTGFLLYALVQPFHHDATWWLAVCGLIAGGAVLWIAKNRTCKATFERLPPSLYAELTIEGQPPSRILETIAWDVRELCAEFYLAKRKRRFAAGRLGREVEERKKVCADWWAAVDGQAEAMLEREGAAVDLAELAALLRGGGDPLDPARCLDDCTRLAKFVRRQLPQVQRLSRMKRLAASEMGVSPRRLCDHLIQFSPTLYYEVALKYVENLREVVHLLGRADPLSPVEEERIKGLLRQNAAFRHDVRQRIKRQTEMLAMHHLHAHMQAYCSDRSTTGAIKKYLAAQASCVEHAPGDEDQRRRESQFHYWKHRAHSGFSIHRLCINLFRNCSDDDAAETVRMLEEMEENPGLAPAPDLLRSLESKALKHMHLARRKLVTHGTRRLEEEVDRDGALLIVTHGYSKTVRDVLRDFLGARSAHVASEVQVFLLHHGQDDLLHDANRMEYELKRSLPRRIRRESGGRLIIAGTSRLLGAIVDSEVRVVFLLGAECYDDSGRVLHPRWRHQGWEDLVRDLTPRAVTSVAVAEKYKRVDRLAAHAHEFHDHVDRVGVYQVDEIITESG